MTLNLTGRYYSTSRDFAVRTTDQPDVGAIEQVFDTDWANGATPPGTGPAGFNLVWSPGAEQPLLGLIGSAQHSLQVENEEMDDTTVTNALVDGGQPGGGRRSDHDLPHRPGSAPSASWRPVGSTCTSTERNAPLYIHAKVIVADGNTAFVGSQNFSDASLNYNRELGMITSDPVLVAPMAATLTADFSGRRPTAGRRGAPARHAFVTNLTACSKLPVLECTRRAVARRQRSGGCGERTGNDGAGGGPAGRRTACRPAGPREHPGHPVADGLGRGGHRRRGGHRGGHLGVSRHGLGRRGGRRLGGVAGRRCSNRVRVFIVLLWLLQWRFPARREERQFSRGLVQDLSWFLLSPVLAVTIISAYLVVLSSGLTAVFGPGT